MNIAVIIRQVPDLVEEFQIDKSGTMLDPDSVSYILNESDNHALEEAILLKEKKGAHVTVFGLDLGEVNDALYNGAARGADRLVKICGDFADAGYLSNAQIAEVFAQILHKEKFDLILIGQYSTDELDAQIAPMLASKLGLPYVGGTRAVTIDGAAVLVDKEFPGAVASRIKVTSPALIGVLTASAPPRYIPVSKLRAAMKTARIDEMDGEIPECVGAVKIRKMYFPEAAGHAEMLEGDVEAVVEKLVTILSQRGLVR